MVRLSKISKGKNASEQGSAREEAEEEKTEEHPKAQVSAAQQEDYAAIERYLTDKHVPELFNKLLTQIIHSKPKDLRQFVIEQLESITKGQDKDYFSSEEFETMFDAYDLAKLGELPYAVLVQALKAVGVADPQIALKEDHPEILETARVNKPKFVQIVQSQFQKRGFSF